MEEGVWDRIHFLQIQKKIPQKKTDAVFVSSLVTMIAAVQVSATCATSNVLSVCTMSEGRITRRRPANQKARQGQKGIKTAVQERH